MRVLVTGAAGWIGTVVAERLARDHHVLAVDRRRPPGLVRGDVIVGDLTDWDLCRTTAARTDAIVHLATGVGAAGSSPAETMEDSVGVTVNLLEAAHAAGIERVVLMSSGAVVLDHARGTWIDADTPPAFTGTYALGKWLQECAARQYAQRTGMKIPILRPWVVVDAATRTLRPGLPMPDPADPLSHNGVFGWIERTDLAEACALSLTAPMEGAPVFHLMANPLGRALYDGGPAEHVLGWRPVHDFRDDIPDGFTLPADWPVRPAVSV